MSTVTNYMLGSTQVINIYYGQTLVWPLNHDYSRDYLTFEAIDTGKFTWTGQTVSTIYYSTDNGSTWNTLYGTWNSPGETVTINAGDKILLKSNFSGSNPGKFGSTGRFNVMGNIMSLQYSDNFVNQTTLTTIFSVLFGGCTQLIDASNLILPATTLIRNCYDIMFAGCTSLTAAPELPATTLAEFCYDGMFKDCTSLTAAPALPATTLANDCYEEMFSGCTSLTTAPALPATTLTQSCYSSMFQGCTSLTTAPELPAPIIEDYAYQYMFYGCTSLNYIKCLATSVRTDYNNCTNNWVNGVAATGTFIKDPNSAIVPDSSLTFPIWTRSNHGIPTGWTVQNDGLVHDYSQDYLTFETLESGSSIRWTDTKNNNSIYYSDDGITWNTLTSGSGIAIGVGAGYKIYFKASNLTIANMYGIGTFSLSGRFKVMGNIMSLVYGDNFTNQTTINSSYQFCKLFNECTTLVDASDLILPATTLSDRCYYWMFSGCSSLTVAPELPATTVNNRSYYGMFRNCSSLTTAPDLPATTINENCYLGMFQGCTSLTTAPSILPALTLATSCYSSMFQGCTSLTTAPELPAPILETRCYENMFKGCTLLNYIKCLATDISAYLVTNNWVVDVAASGTFVKANSQSWYGTSAGSGIPSGWTVQNAS